jgi:cell wall-associated NlpC family hydrolase
MSFSAVGIPYVAGGRDVTGADCYGVAALASRALFGVDLPAHPAADVAADAGWRPVPIGAERAGDFAEMHTIAADGVRLHCGLVMTPGRLLTTTEATGSVVLGYTARRTHGIVRFWRAASR